MVSDGQAHDCLDLTDRLSLDTVSEVFFGQSLETLFTKEQPIRNAVEKMYKNNTLRHILGYVYAVLGSKIKALFIVLI
jgi:hypothetical protein